MNMKSHVIGNCVKGIFLAVFLLGSLVGLSSLTAAQTSEPSREPILRIETGMHTADITRIGVDAANRFLVIGPCPGMLNRTALVLPKASPNLIIGQPIQPKRQHCSDLRE
jgi:hypothetical protein